MGDVFYGQAPAWGIIGKRKGHEQIRSMQFYFGTAGSKDEILDRTIARLRDPVFRQHWHGWIFCPVLLDEQLEVFQNGHLKVLRRLKNATEDIVVVGG